MYITYKNGPDKYHINTDKIVGIVTSFNESKFTVYTNTEKFHISTKAYRKLIELLPSLTKVVDLDNE